MYLVPGMYHCRGGEFALDNFDLLAAAVNWVEKGTAPDRESAGSGDVQRQLIPRWRRHSRLPINRYQLIETLGQHYALPRRKPAKTIDPNPVRSIKTVEGSGVATVSTVIADRAANSPVVLPPSETVTLTR
jgi:hypothetical protein